MQQKQCGQCLKMLPLSDFYAAGTGKFGRRSHCKHCEKTYTDANKERVDANKKAWYVANRERISADAKQRRSTPEGKALLRNQSKAYRVANMDKRRARHAVSNALRDGRLTRQPCQFCGGSKSQAHHEDYTRPLDVTWACFKCHRENLHGQVVASGAW